MLSFRLCVELVTNGIEYNDKKEKVVRIGFDDEGRKRMFYVADNGLGIKVYSLGISLTLSD